MAVDLLLEGGSLPTSLERGRRCSRCPVLAQRSSTSRNCRPRIFGPPYRRLRPERAACDILGEIAQRRYCLVSGE